MSQDHSSTVNPFALAKDSPRTERALSDQHERGGFVPGLTLGMLAVVLTGFGPTFLLRILFDVPDIPTYLILHGAVSTTWFVLLFVQSLLVGRGSLKLHGRLGMGGVVVALAMVVSGVQTSLGMIPRRLADGMHLDAAELEFLGLISSANFAFFLVFPTLVLLAVLSRRRPDVHRRLMLVASISILGPAAIRISSWFGEIPNPITPIIVFGFLAALVFYDISTRGRPHAATILAATFAIAVNATFQLLGIGDAVIAHQIASWG